MNWWFKPVPLASAAVFRLFVYGFIPLDVVVFRPWGAAHGYVDPALYAPLRLAGFSRCPLQRRRSSRYSNSSRGSCDCLVVLVLTNRMSKLQTILGWVAAFGYLEWMVISFSYGKVDHDRFAFLVALFVLPTIGRAALRDQTPSQSAGWALRNVQIAIVATYFLAACAKVRFGGWGWVNSATILRAVVRRGTFLADPLMDQPWTLQVTQWFIVIIEFASPILLFVRERWQYLIVAGLVIFHIMTFAMITIIFLPHVLCMLSFLPLERLVPRWRSAQTPSADPQPQPSV